jgi:hypothetical protein
MAEQASVECGRTFVFGHDFRALVSYANDRRAGFSLRLFIDGRKHLLEPFDLTLGFTMVLFKSRPKLFTLSRFCHLR